MEGGTHAILFKILSRTKAIKKQRYNGLVTSTFIIALFSCYIPVQSIKVTIDPLPFLVVETTIILFHTIDFVENVTQFSL